MAKKKTKKDTSSKANTKAKTKIKHTSEGEQTVFKSYASKQMLAVIMFAVAVFLLFVAIISAEDAAVWNVLHKGLLGFFGIGAYLVPVVVGYLAIATALDKDEKTVVRRLWSFGIALWLVQTVFAVFSLNVKSMTYGEALVEAFHNGTILLRGGGIGGGMFGMILGYPFEYLLSDVGAKVTLILLLFVLVMWITKTSLLTLWKPVKKTAEFTRDKIREVKETAASTDDGQEKSPLFSAKKKEKSVVQAEKPTSDSRIDIDMGDGYVDPPVKDPKAAFEQAANSVREERDRPQLRIDDIIGRAMEQQETVRNVSTEPEEHVPAMTAEEVRQEEAAVAQQIEEQEAVYESYTYPPLSLLKKPSPVNDRTAREEMQMNAELLVQTLKEFGISAKVVDISRGPSVTRYELQPNAGVKISRITGLADDIALRLATTGVRIEAPIPNKAAIGIEVPNKARGSVCLRELIDSDEFSEQQSRLTVALGRDISGQIVTADLASMPHLLIAGTTGSGKSVCTNSMIQSVLYHSSPEEVRMILIDPKQVEFSMYNGIPHLLVPVVTNPRKAAGALGWAVTEMINRYNTFTENNVRDIKSYNKLAKTSDNLNVMPQILIVIDELSDLMMAAGKEVEDAIVRLAQMARAAGMHLVIATQRPSVDVITGLIKANIPSRLALTVASAVDSRTILDTGGAEKLLGKGDMLFHPVGLAKPIRVQGCFVSDDEIAAVVEFLKTSSTARYDEQVVEEINRQAEEAERSDVKGGGDDDGSEADSMLPQAIQEVVDAGQASVSLIQRRLKVGYARAGRLIDEMEQRGIIGPHEGSKPRQVLISRQQWLEMQSNRPEQSGQE